MAEATFQPLRTTASFVKIECADCSTPNIVYARASTVVTCSNCGVGITQATGGLVSVRGEVAKELE